MSAPPTPSCRNRHGCRLRRESTRVGTPAFALGFRSAPCAERLRDTRVRACGSLGLSPYFNAFTGFLVLVLRSFRLPSLERKLATIPDDGQFEHHVQTTGRVDPGRVKKFVRNG